MLKHTENIDEFEKAIEIAFMDDTELFDKYHVINGDSEASIADTKFRIKDIELYLPVERFLLKKENNTIGFTCLSKIKNILYSFGININHRDKDTVLEWFSEVKRMLSDNFVCILHKKNTRAVSFMKRNGMKPVLYKDEYVKLKYHK